MNKPPKYILIIIVVTMIIGGGIFAWKYLKTHGVFGDKTANWEIYQSNKYGFKVKYPNDWYVNSDMSGGGEIIYLSKFSPNEVDVATQSQVSTGLPQEIIMITVDSGQYSSAENFLQEMNQFGAYQSKTEITVGTEKGYKAELYPASGLYDIILYKAGKIFVISQGPSSGIFDLLLSTFKFIENDECQKMLADTKNDLESANFCEKNDDCKVLEIVPSDTVLGCSTFINRTANRYEIGQKIDNYIKKCEPSANERCAIPIESICVNKKCTEEGIATLSDTPFSYPYPVSWMMNGLQHAITGISLNAISTSYPFLNFASNDVYIPPYLKIKEEVRALTFYLKIHNPAMTDSADIPLNFRRILNEEGDAVKPNFSSVTPNIEPNTTLTDLRVIFVFPETSREFLFSISNNPDIFFTVRISDNNVLELEKVITTGE